MSEERLIDALQLLARYEYMNDKTKLPGVERMCPCCGWPEGGHRGLGRYKGNEANTHEEGCSLRAALDGLPAPRLVMCNDRPSLWSHARLTRGTE